MSGIYPCRFLESGSLNVILLLEAERHFIPDDK